MSTFLSESTVFTSPQYLHTFEKELHVDVCKLRCLFGLQTACLASRWFSDPSLHRGAKAGHWNVASLTFPITLDSTGPVPLGLSARTSNKPTWARVSVGNDNQAGICSLELIHSWDLKDPRAALIAGKICVSVCSTRSTFIRFSRVPDEEKEEGKG